MYPEYESKIHDSGKVFRIVGSTESTTSTDCDWVVILKVVLVIGGSEVIITPGLVGRPWKNGVP